MRQSPNVCGGKEAGNPLHVDDALAVSGIVHALFGKAQCTAYDKAHSACTLFCWVPLVLPLQKIGYHPNCFDMYICGSKRSFFRPAGIHCKDEKKSSSSNNAL